MSAGGRLDINVGKCDIQCHDIARGLRDSGTGVTLLPAVHACNGAADTYTDPAADTDTDTDQP